MKIFNRLTIFAGAVVLGLAPAAYANQCEDLPTHAELLGALQGAVFASGGPTNGGLDIHMWATVVDRDGRVCAIAFSGAARDEQWPASRVISAQKANTSNGLTITQVPGIWSTAKLFTPTQPGQFLFGLQESNPVDAEVAYHGNPQRFGQPNDPLVGRKPGGINVFGGGLSLWDAAGEVIGGVGASGDTSCADHNIAWRIRDALVALDPTRFGPNPADNLAGAPADNILYDIGVTAQGAPGTPGVSASGFGHPVCSAASVDINEALTGYDQPTDGCADVAPAGCP